MNGRNRINYALIAALFDNKEADFNTDIFIPVVQYQLSILISENNGESYKDSDCISLKDGIEKNFGLTIPLVVLQRLLKYIAKNNNEVSFKFYHDHSYEVHRSWTLDINKSVEKKTDEIELKIYRLENGFKEYIKKRDLDVNYDFNALLEANTCEVIQYVDKGEVQDVINQEYIHISNYLLGLKRTNPDLFDMASHAMWASTIAGFLKRRSIEPNIKVSKKISYFLDTKIILALLELANEDQVNYQKDMLNHILMAGCVPCVHALTIREIKQILYSVSETGAPYPYSGMEQAYYRRNLKPSNIVNIYAKLETLLTELHIEVLDVPKDRLDGLIREYEHKSGVRKLRQRRSENNSQLRDIHDSYMIDFIRKKQNKSMHIEKVDCFFVTNNDDLVCIANASGNIPIFLKPNYVILDLWTHNIYSTMSETSVLSTVISKTFALNDYDTRKKMKSLANVLKTASEGEIDDTVYQKMYSSVANRSSKMLSLVDKIESCETEEEKKLLRKEICAIANSDFEKNKQLNKELESNIVILTGEIQKLQLVSQEDKKTSSQKMLNIQIEKLELEISNFKDKKELCYRKIYQSVKNSRLHWKSISYIGKMILYVFTILFKGAGIIAIIYLILLLILPHEKGPQNDEYWKYWLSALGVALSLLATFKSKEARNNLNDVKELIANKKTNELLSMNNEYHDYELQQDMKEKELAILKRTNT